MGDDATGGIVFGEVDPEAARRAADEILARAEYQPPAESLLLRVLRWVLRRFDLPEPAPSGGGRGLSLPWLQPLAWLLLIAIVGFALYHVGRVLARHGWVRRSAAASDDDDETETTADVAPTATEWDADAAAHEAAGRWREAVLARYRATVQRLAGSGAVRPRPGSSTGEIRGQLQERLPDAGAPFEAMTATFEDVHYGGAQPDAATGEAVRRQADAVLTMLPAFVERRDRAAASDDDLDGDDLDGDDDPDGGRALATEGSLATGEELATGDDRALRRRRARRS